MSISRAFPVLSGNSFGKKSVAFGTAITRVIPCRKGCFTRINKLVYTAAGTAHTITILRSLGRTTTSAAAAASQAVINIVANPGPSGNALAANDYVAYRRDDGSFCLDTVSSISSLAVTLTTNLTAALAAGADVWMFGVVADTDPLNGGEAHQGFTGTASATTTYSEDLIGIAASNQQDEPLMVYSNNATATGTIEQVTYSHTQN